jgi:RNA polymerase sigma-70 factor (ECF subfamily)
VQTRFLPGTVTAAKAAIAMFTLSRTLNRLADEDLMELVREGESRAFEIIFDRHGDSAYSLAYRMCGSRTRAEDVVQDAFLSLWRSGTRYDRTRGSVRSWILSVVHNRAVDTFRREATRSSLQVGDEGLAERLPSGELIEADAERRDDAGRVRGALRDLPVDQREVIELSYFGGFTHLEIAEMLSLPPGTVKGRMRLGLSKLRIALGTEGSLP